VKIVFLYGAAGPFFLLFLMNLLIYITWLFKLILNDVLLANPVVFYKVVVFQEIHRTISRRREEHDGEPISDVLGVRELRQFEV